MKRLWPFLLGMACHVCLLAAAGDAYAVAPDIAGPSIGYAKEAYYFQIETHWGCHMGLEWVLVRCDWGDGSTSEWEFGRCDTAGDPQIRGGHAWAIPGTYYIQAQSACPDGMGNVVNLSEWSTPHRITISSPPPPNRAPTDISLSATLVAEDWPVDTAVGLMSTVDPNPGDNFSYSLVSVDGDPLATAFRVVGRQLKTGEVFDYETKNIYVVRIRSTDLGGLFKEKDFTIRVGKAFRAISYGAHDGWILESSEISGGGGTTNAGSATVLVGDDAADRQYRSVFSFNTAGVPDNAVILFASLKIKSKSVVGRNPFTTHGPLHVDIMKGAFSGKNTLNPSDFQAVATSPTVMLIPRTLTAGWHAAPLSTKAITTINKTGLTQFRLRFAKDDNDDLGADYLSLYSGNAPISVRPVLEVLYALP